MSTLPIPRIEVREAIGKSGAFDFHPGKVWHCVLVGVDGTERSGGDWMSEGYGSPNKSYADTYAAQWHKFTGWPVFQTVVRETVTTVVVPREPDEELKDGC